MMMMSDLLTNHQSSNTRVVKDENNLCVCMCVCLYECLGELPPGTEQLFTHQLRVASYLQFSCNCQ